jgi:hypothetical protein
VRPGKPNLQRGSWEEKEEEEEEEGEKVVKKWRVERLEMSFWGRVR